ncbi:MAG TPA: 3-oxoacyl-ACP synthase [Mucilaginibacter sp.]
MEAAQQAIADAQAAAADDTKSSAGDKYETGREMAQQQTDRNMAVLNETNKLLIALNKINPTVVSDKVGPGSVVFTNNGNFYIAVSAGAIMVSDDRFFAISPASPIGLKLAGLKAGAEFKLNDKIYQIKKVI